VNRGAYPADSTRWHVSAEPRVSIAGEHPEIGGLYRLLPEGSAVRLATGTIVVANAAGSELAYIRPDGTPITVVTSVGGGPREYRRIARVAPHPEGGVGAWDRSRGRILVYDSVGTFVRAIEVATPEGQPGWAFMSNGGLRGFLGDGSFVLLSELRLDEEAAVVRHRYVVTINTDDGSRAAVVDSLAGPELDRSDGPGSTFAEAPFDALPEVLVTDAEILLIDPVAAEIRVHDSTGTLKRISRRVNPERLVTVEDIEALEAHMRAAVESEALADELAEDFADIDWPTHRGAFRYARAGPHGEILVLEPGDCGGPGGFCRMAYDSIGRLVGTIALPPELFVEQVGDDFLMALDFGESGVRTYVVHDLEKR
jgi:hypothetical protein